MVNLEQFISKYVMGRDSSLFARDVQKNSVALSGAVCGKSMLACMLGGNREFCFSISRRSLKR